MPLQEHRQSKTDPCLPCLKKMLSNMKAWERVLSLRVDGKERSKGEKKNLGEGYLCSALLTEGASSISLCRECFTGFYTLFIKGYSQRMGSS